MKNNYLLLAFILGLITVSSAKQVELGYAKQVAQNFCQQNNPSGGPIILHPVYECKTNSNVGRSSDGRTVYYIFNVGENQGFVIVSGEEMVRPILAYSTKGSYSVENVPPSVKAWMDKYKMEIVYVIENVTETTEEISSKWYNLYNNKSTGSSRATQGVNPLCQTTWNQNPYYNNMCPYDNNYQAYCVTGCVATAMAQILKYWNYPSQGSGNHSYNSTNYGTLSANYGATTYNWANMPNAISSDNTEIETLMSHCGISVDMNYSPQESGAWVITADAGAGGACAQNSYVSYFGYNPDSIKGLQRANYSDNNWTNLIINELNLNRPVQYVGSGPGGGHTWVCDGYDGNGNFHMNWGWGSQDDGFYSIDALSPINPGTGGGDGDFNSGEEAVIGIVPLTNTGGGSTIINQDSIIIYAPVTANADPIQIGSQLVISTAIANAGSTAFTGDFAAALFNSDGVFNGFVQVYSNQTLGSNLYYNVTFTLDTIDVIPGLYYVGIYYKNGSNNYTLINPTSYSNPITITVTGPYNDIQMYSNDTILPATPQVNQAFNIHVDISNVGTSTFNGYIDAYLFKLDGTGVTDIQEVSSSMLSGYYYNFNFSTAGLNVAPGTYYVGFFSTTDQVNYTLLYGANYPNPVEVTIVGQPLSPDIYESDNTEGTAYALPVTFSGNNAAVNTAGSNIHVGNDYDYYKVDLPSGTNYSVVPVLHDSKNSAFTDDVVFSYKVNNGNWSDAYANTSGPIFVQNGGTVIFYVSDNFLGTIGTYQLDMNIARGSDVGITETELGNIKLFPNPVSNLLSIEAADMKGNYQLQILNALGDNVVQHQGAFNGQLIQTDVSNLASGVYILQLKTDAGILNSKFTVK
ncbi:MAG: Peptidase family protein [Bacteroidota bacterium]|nr:Peptidase family protein [Bacteroidota bacterium]